MSTREPRTVRAELCSTTAVVPSLLRYIYKTNRPNLKTRKCEQTNELNNDKGAEPLICLQYQRAETTTKIMYQVSAETNNGNSDYSSRSPLVGSSLPASTKQTTTGAA